MWKCSIRAGIVGVQPAARLAASHCGPWICCRRVCEPDSAREDLKGRRGTFALDGLDRTRSSLPRVPCRRQVWRACTCGVSSVQRGARSSLDAERRRHHYRRERRNDASRVVLHQPGAGCGGSARGYSDRNRHTYCDLSRRHLTSAPVMEQAIAHMLGTFGQLHESARHGCWRLSTVTAAWTS